MYNILYILISFCLVANVSAVGANSYDDKLNIESSTPSIPAITYDSKLSTVKDPSLQVYRDAHKGRNISKVIQQQNVVDRTTELYNSQTGSVVINNNFNNTNSEHTKFVNKMGGDVFDVANYASGRSKSYDPKYNSLYIPLELFSLIHKDE